MSVGASAPFASEAPAPARVVLAEGGSDATAFVLLAWLAASVLSFVYVAAFASPIPFADDLSLAQHLAGRERMGWESLTGLYNEHVVAVTKLLVVPLTLLAGDIRVGMFLQVGLFSLLALASVLVVRRLRGASSYSDAFFPLLWLGWGNPFNFLMAFQVAISLPALIVGSFLLRAAARPTAPGAPASALLGLGLLAAPLCSAAGVLLVPPLAAWLGLCALEQVRAGARAAALASAAGALAGLCAVALYVVLASEALGPGGAPSLGQALATANRFHGLALGASGARAAPWSGWLVALAALAALLLALRAMLRRPSERLQAAGVAAALAATLGISATIAWGRGAEPLGGIALRYISLPAPLLAAAYLAAELWASPGRGRLARFALFALVALPFGDNLATGAAYGRMRASESAAILRDLRAGLPLASVSEAHPELMADAGARAAALDALRAAGLAPFDAPEVPQAWPELALAAHQAARAGTGLEPDELEAPGGSTPRRVFGLHTLAVHGSARLRYAKEPGVSRVGLVFGMLPVAYQWAQSDGLRFCVELETEEGEVLALFERALDPLRVDSDRGPQAIELRLPGDLRGTLVVRTSNDPGRDDEADWAFVAGVVLR